MLTSTSQSLTPPLRIGRFAAIMDSESVVSQVQRRIELQSPEDLTYLITNVRNAAAARLNEAFPHVDGHEGEDELRNQIEAMVNDVSLINTMFQLTVPSARERLGADSDEKYINKTFTLASPNLSINGLPVTADAFLGGAPTAPDTTYEPFDARKRQRVADLITQEEKLLEEVASLKRAVPSRAAAAHAEKLRDGLKADEDALAERRSRVEAEAAAAPEGGPWLQGVGPLERQEDVEKGYRGAVEVLARLKTDMAAMLAKMERARVAGEYVVTETR